MMRRMFKFFALLCIFALPLAANAEVLLWFVNTPVNGTDFGGNTVENIDWSYAVLRATSASSANSAIYGGTGAPVETNPPYDSGVSAATGVAVDNYVGSRSGQYAVSQTTFANASGSDVAANLDSLAALGLDASALSFYVELYDSSNILVAYSSAQTYSELSNFRNDSQFFADWSSYSSWNPTDWTAVPEPTSGMLALLGLVALGLRRRRV